MMHSCVHIMCTSQQLRVQQDNSDAAQQAPYIVTNVHNYIYYGVDSQPAIINGHTSANDTTSFRISCRKKTIDKSIVKGQCHRN